MIGAQAHCAARVAGPAPRGSLAASGSTSVQAATSGSLRRLTSVQPGRCASSAGSGSGRAWRQLAPAPRATATPPPPPPAPTAAPSLPFRIGHGWDLHRLEPGYDLIIGGIKIPHDRGCVAHSDGDVLLHTVTDALLGALSLPDIGQLYPDTDPAWKGASSDRFLLDAAARVRAAGYRIGNVDATIVAQRPKLSPHKERIRENLCRLLGAHASAVNVKAKTHEKVDSLGENRSIAAEAVVLLIRDETPS